MKNNNLISLTAKASSGKDLVAEIIQYLTYYNGVNTERTFSEWVLLGKPVFKKEYQIKKWAGPLRKVASILLGMDEQYLYTTEFKESILSECWNYFEDHHLKKYFNSPYPMSDGPKTADKNVLYSHKMTGRLFLQLLGTNAIRDGLHPNSWINALMAEYRPPKMSEYNPSKWIVSDTRFENELKAIKDRNGICIKIVRPSLVSTDSHSSETSLDHITDWDHVIINDGTIEDLVEKVKIILEQEGIL